MHFHYNICKHTIYGMSVRYKRKLTLELNVNLLVQRELIQIVSDPLGLNWVDETNFIIH